MKLLLNLILILAFAYSCNSVDNNGIKGLTADEITYLREKARLQCISDSTSNFRSYRDQSDDQYNGSSSNKFYRNKSWIYTLKEGSNTTASITSNISVWKVDAVAVYFVIRTTYLATNSVMFLKITSATNDEMINDLQTKKCSETLASTTKVTNSSSTVYVHDVLTDSSSKITTYYTHPYNLLAYFGTFMFTKSSQPLDTTGHPSGSATSYTGTLESDGDAVLLATYNLYTSPKYCTIPFTAGAPNIYSLPYPDLQALAASANCTSTSGVGPADWPNPGSEL